MRIEDLKDRIESKNINDVFYIFKRSEGSDFLIDQYIKEIASILKKDIYYVEDLKYILNKNINIFNVQDNSLNIYKCHKLNNSLREGLKSIILVCDEISDTLSSLYSDCIVEFPSVEKWQLNEYIRVLAEGLDENALKLLESCYNDNPFKAENEISKFNIFPVSQRKYILEDILRENPSELCGNAGIFDIIKCLQLKDIKELDNKYLYIKDIDPITFLSLTYQSFKNLTVVQGDPNPTSESTGLKSNQLWAIKNLPRVYSKDQLITILRSLSILDYKVRAGLFPINKLKDYIITRILTV